MLSIPYFEEGIPVRAISSFLYDLEAGHVFLFSVLICIAAAGIDSALVKKGILCPIEDEKNGFLKVVGGFFKSFFSVIISAGIGLVAVALITEFNLSDIFNGIAVIISALFVQKAIKGDKSFLSRAVELGFEIYTSGDVIAENVRTALGPFLLSAIVEIILCLVLSAIFGKTLTYYDDVLGSENYGANHKYTIAEVADKYIEALPLDNVAMPEDGIIGGILDTKINHSWFIFLRVLPYSCMVTSVVSIILGLGLFGMLMRYLLGSVKHHINELPSNMVEHRFKDNDGVWNSVTVDSSLHVFLSVVRVVIILPVAFVLGLLFGLILPLDILICLIIGLIGLKRR